MATSRTTAKKTSTKTAAPASGAELTCPECGRTFSRPAALGAHRRRAHGVVGSSAARARRGATRTAARATSRRPRAQASTRAAAAPRDGARGSVDHDALLKTLFPGGIPPRQATVTAVNAWLAEADKLARLR
jgi:hypothetical protein